jgi:pimeloyl-ACP methyl ester carboxylesterase
MTTRPVLRSTAITDHVASAEDGNARTRASEKTNRYMAEDSILTRRIAGDGVELAVTVDGVGEPVVFLHGFPENARSWRHQMAAVVRAGFSAWAPDLRGYNTSGRPRERAAYHLKHLMADVAALVRATGFPRAHIVGHDWGGIIAWSVAGHYPELVDRLVILNAPHLKLFTDKVWRSSQWLRSSYVGVFLLPQVPEWLLSARDFALLRRVFHTASGRRMPFTGEDIDAYIAAFRTPGALTAALNYYRANAFSDGTPLGAAARVHCPTLVIWGDKDRALGHVLLEDLDTVAPDVHVHRLREVGHWVQNEAPEEVNRLIVSFLTPRGRGES